MWSSLTRTAGEQLHVTSYDKNIDWLIYYKWDSLNYQNCSLRRFGRMQKHGVQRLMSCTASFIHVKYLSIFWDCDGECVLIYVRPVDCSYSESPIENTLVLIAVKISIGQSANPDIAILRRRKQMGTSVEIGKEKSVLRFKYNWRLFRDDQSAVVKIMVQRRAKVTAWHGSAFFIAGPS